MDKSIEMFLSSFGEELKSKVNRLDKLIGKDHWLSVGNYKESLLRNILRMSLPKKYEISTGFIVSSAKDGNVLKSTQMDIIIWNSLDYSPIFRDGEFVLIPPEACKVVIEVKGKLKLAELKKTMNNFEHFTKFFQIPNSNIFNIKKYIFAFDLDEHSKFPYALIKTISGSYNKINFFKSMKWQEFLRRNDYVDIFALDGIYLLNHGIIRKDIQFFKGGNANLLFTSYSNEPQNYDLVYSIFEHEIQSLLGFRSNGNQNNWYADQPGLLAFKNNMKISVTTPKSKLIIPPIQKEDLLERFDKRCFFSESFL